MGGTFGIEPFLFFWIGAFGLLATLFCVLRIQRRMRIGWVGLAEQGVE